MEVNMGYKLKHLQTALTISILASLPGMGHGQNLGYQPDIVSPFFYTGSGDFTDGFGLQGIKAGDSKESFIITGTSNVNGVVYVGPVNHGFTNLGSGTGTWYVMNVPTSFNAGSTSIYGPENLGNNNVNLVGSYVSNASGSPRIGFYYTGPLLNTVGDSSGFSSYQGRNLSTGTLADFTYIHSVSGGQANSLAVGNYGFQTDGNPFGYAFIYNPANPQQPQIDIKYPDTDKTHTAYGIWYNGGTSYTIAGGVGLPSGSSKYGEPFGSAYLMDYDSSTGIFSNYHIYNFKPSGSDKKFFKGKTLVTHFEGIWSDGKGLYKFPATVTTTDGGLGRPKVAHVKRRVNGKFNSSANWSPIPVPGTTLSTNDSIYGDISIGLATYPAIEGVSDQIISSYAVTPIKR